MKPSHREDSRLKRAGMTNTPSSIKSWPKHERPRERLLAQGPEALSDAELLAILLRSGLKGKDVLTLSRNILEVFGSLRGLGSAPVKDFKKIKGLGISKITTLLAANEISRRQLRESMARRDLIREPESVLLYLKKTLRDRTIEIFKVIFLNRANAIIGEEDVSRGTIDEAAVHPREIVKKALEVHATSLILVHNHPSGRTEPSNEDREITWKIMRACETINVKILDHIIIAGDGYYSFREHNLLRA